MGATRSEMAARLDVAESTIHDQMDRPTRFRAVYRRGLANLQVRLRHRQIQLAMAGDVKMLTWLGMQLLGQKNVARQETQIQGKVDQNFTFTIHQGTDAEGNPVEAVKVEATPVASVEDAGDVEVIQEATVNVGGDEDER